MSSRKTKHVRHVRPLSPHLTIYKPQISSITSIMHRATGFFLVIGSLPLTAWLVTLAYYPEYYPQLTQYMRSMPLIAVMFLWSFAFYYHFCNGIRHLFWDMGYGFELHHMTRSGIFVLFASLLLTAVNWYIILDMGT